MMGVPIRAPKFSAKRLVLFVTGSVNAAMVPFWANWARHVYAELVIDILVSRAATRFVTCSALKQMTSGDVLVDDWDSFEEASTTHAAWESRAECFGIFPASLNSTMRLANGISDSPALLALQTTEKPIAVAPAFPGTNELVESRLTSLSARANVVMTGTVPAFRIGASTWGARSGFYLPLLLEALEELVDRGDK